MGRSNIDVRYIAVSGTNIGGGTGILKSINPVNFFSFKTLVGGANIELISGTGDTITISGASGGGGGVSTANNGLTKSGSNVGLGGTLSGATTITSPATGLRLSFAGFPIQYSADLSGNYNNRSIVDRGYVTGITNTLVTKTNFNLYTGTTAPATYYTKTQINTYSGTTVPATYYNKTQINAYTGATATAIGLKSNIASPTFTGVPAAPSAVVNTNTTQIATTAFVLGQAANVNPLVNGTVALGTSLRYARQDHVHPTDTSRLAVSVFNAYTGSSSAIVTANNGLTKSGTNVRLGGSLTGATTVTSPATGSRLSFAGFPVQYSADYSANFNPRSLVDKGYVTGLTASISPNHSNIVYVSKNGNDGTGAINNITKPYLTINAALTAANATTGKTSTNRYLVYVLPGTYTITSGIVMRDFVDVYLMDGVYITTSTLDEVFGWGNNIDASIYGYGDINATYTIPSPGTFYYIFTIALTQKINNKININVKSITLNVLTNAFGYVLNDGSNAANNYLNFNVQTISLSNLARGFAVTGVGTKRTYITFNEIIHSGTSSISLFLLPTTGTVYIKGNRIVANSFTSGTAILLPQGGDTYCDIVSTETSGFLMNAFSPSKTKIRGKHINTSSSTLISLAAGSSVYLESGTALTTAATNSIGNNGTAYYYGDVYSNKIANVGVTVGFGTLNVTASPLF